MERGLPQRHLYRHAAGPLAAPRGRDRDGRRKLPRARKRAGDRGSPEKEMSALADCLAAYIAAVLEHYVELPDTPLRASVADQWFARRLHDDGVPLNVVE